jgi:hypothetical protein
MGKQDKGKQQEPLALKAGMGAQAQTPVSSRELRELPKVKEGRLLGSN